MPENTASVIVVGAGPAGAAAGYFLAQAGVDVLLVDQATFPRDKICGDGNGIRALRALEKMGLLDWAIQRGSNPFLRCLLSAPDGSRVVTRSAGPRPDAYAIPRLELDAALLAKAVSAGARTMENTRILGLERLDASRVRLSGETAGRAVALQAPLVIAADGGLVSFTRRLGLSPVKAEWVAVRGYFEGDSGDVNSMEIHWERAVMPGYGWVFPVGEGRANVGLGAYSRDVERLGLNLHAMLRTFMAQNPDARARLSEAHPAGPVRGYPLRADAPDATPYAANVLVAGEAAGVVSPLSGEGIGPALQCGELAAAHARQALERGDFSAAALAGYGRAFHGMFDAHHRAARLVRSLLSRPWLISRTIRRAGHDAALAQLLNQVILGVETPAALLKPGVMLKMLAG